MKGKLEQIIVSLQSARCEELHLHAENLSRRVWELLMLLPTCPKMLLAFQNISDDTVCHDSDATPLRSIIFNALTLKGTTDATLGSLVFDHYPFRIVNSDHRH